MFLEPTSKKYLCVCDGGNVRSHALSFNLKWIRHQESIALGRLHASPATIEMLADWADRIILMQPHMIESFPERYHSKIYVADVGPDRWGVYIHPELKGMVDQIALDLVSDAAEPFLVP